MEQILEVAKKHAQQAEVFSISLDETPVHFEANRLKHIQGKQEQSLALRIIKDGKIGYATSSSNNNRELVDMALETAHFGQEVSFDLPEINEYPQVDIYDQNTGNIPLETMIEIGEELIGKLRKASKDIICQAQVAKSTICVSLINSSGFKAQYNKSLFSIAIEGSLIRGTDMLFVGDSLSSCRPITSTKNLTDTVLKQLEYANILAPITTGTLPVIFTPQGVASAIIPSLATAFNGKVVLEGASPIGDKLGKVVFDRRFSLYDNPTLPFKPRSRPFDDEGIPSRNTPLIIKGKVSSFFYDLKTASQAKTKSTGNGQRAGSGMPGPSPSALVISPGDTDFLDMVADIKEGLVVEYLMGAEQGNILSGDFSGNVLLGYKIENGRIAGRVKNTMLHGNIYQSLNNLVAIGNDWRWVGGSLKTPSLYFSRLSVAAK